MTPQNYCQISRTHEQVKLVKETLSRKTCSLYIPVNKLVKKLVKENLLSSVRGLKQFRKFYQSGYFIISTDISDAIKRLW